MKNILLTTSEHISGFEIIEYKYPVFAHVVSGAGFLSEFNASFSDLFGSRSESYENRLQSLNKRSLEILKLRAREAGANCVIGLRVDSDQISGKSNQLFMITAYGTAVVIKDIKSQAIVNTGKETDNTSVKDRTRLLKLISSINELNLKISFEDLELIVNSKMTVFKDLILYRLKVLLSGKYPMETNDTQRAIALYSKYFSIAEDDNTVKVLYDALLNESDFKIINGIISLIKSNDLVNYNEVKNLILQGTIEIKKQALNILAADKSHYILNDIYDINDLLKTIDTSFPNIASIGSKKGFLSSNEKEIWTCICGKSNNMDETYCAQCNNDMYGFKQDDLKPNAVTDFLKRKAVAISELLNE